MASGEMDRSEFTAFLTRACRNVAAFSVDGSLPYLCMDWRHLEELRTPHRRRHVEALRREPIFGPNGSSPRRWFVDDSLLEGEGFEPSVPRERDLLFKSAH
jgi:hypothetical protein